MINEKFEILSGSLDELANRSIKVDATRKLKGKGVDLVFKIVLEDGKAIALPKKITLLPFFIAHMMHKGTSYVEDSITSETRDNKVLIKPLLITRKKVSNAVCRTLRNSARNWIVDYLKTKTSSEVFEEILSNQMQRPLSLRLKKVYPLAICEVRIFEIGKPIEGKEEVIGQIEVKSEEKKIEKADSTEEVEKIEENIEISEPETKAEEKPIKKRKAKSEEK